MGPRCQSTRDPVHCPMSVGRDRALRGPGTVPGYSCGGWNPFLSSGIEHRPECRGPQLQSGLLKPHQNEGWPLRAGQRAGGPWGRHSQRQEGAGGPFSTRRMKADGNAPDRGRESLLQ